MSIFDNIKKPPKSKEIDLLIKLKYGEPSHTNEYLDTLPAVVIERAYKKINYMTTYHTTNRKDALKLELQRNYTGRRITLEAIHESLVEYHTLLG